MPSVAHDMAVEANDGLFTVNLQATDAANFQIVRSTYWSLFLSPLILAVRQWRAFLNFTKGWETLVQYRFGCRITFAFGQSSLVSVGKNRRATGSFFAFWEFTVYDHAPMLVLILLAVGFTLFHFFYGKNDHTYGFFSRVRLAFIQMLLAGGLLVYVSTEVLSFFDRLNTTSIFCFWGLVVTGVGYFNFKHNYWQLKISDLRNAWDSLTSKTQWLFGLVLMVYLLPLLFLAVYAPPNNTDSANYHLARVVFWLQNQNVKHFPTVYIQQLYHNVFSEYILLHIMALSGWDDYFVNLVQWLAMLGSVFAIGLVGKQLGFGQRSQLVVSILQLTCPIGILESTTTQNDYLAGFLFLAFLYFGLCLMPKKNKARWSNTHILWLSVALALGGFNKYTVFLFGFPICVWIGFVLLKNAPFQYSIRTVLVASICLVVVFTPFFKRNYDLFGNVLSSTKGTPLFTEEVATERHCVGCVVSVTLKNLTAHLGLPFQDYNDKIDQAVAAMHQWLGVPLNGPELNVDDYYTRFVIQEDMSHNPWHFILILVGAIWLIFQKNHRDFKILLLCAVTGFVLFSALIKYQIYNSRVEMPFFAMGFLWTGLMLSRLNTKCWVENSLSISFFWRYLSTNSEWSSKT